MAARIIGALAAAGAVISADDDDVNLKRKHKCWMRPWIAERKNEECNTSYKLQKELQLGDVPEFMKMMRMPPVIFDWLLGMIRDKIERRDTNYRKAISPEERLSITLNYLASGTNMSTLARDYRVGHCTVGRVIKDTCKAIFDVISPEFLRTPETPDEWEEVAQGFEDRWNYPFCLGALDGKHIMITKPNKSGSTHYNYKNFFSIILLAICNSNYEFLYAEVGNPGSVADGGSWQDSKFQANVERGKILFPPPRIYHGFEMQHHFVADDAFAMTVRLLKPYPDRSMEVREHIFNRRLSRARITIENCFGILASRFQCLRQPINMNPNDATSIVLAICVLHNVLRQKVGSGYFPPGQTEHLASRPTSFDTSSTRYRLPDLNALAPRRFTNEAKAMRENLTTYFMTRQGEWEGQYFQRQRPVADMIADL